jgi:hypothetical protein
MNLRQLIGFFIKASADHRIGPHHVAIYMALFQQWCIEGSKQICVTQNHIRLVSKVGRTTYHKCMRELHAYGYIHYTPTSSSALRSLVCLIDLEA